MRWKGRRQSENVEDRRGVRGGTVVGGGIGLLIMAMIVAFLGGDPRQFLQQAQQGQVQDGGQAGEVELTAVEKEQGDFAKTIFADAEDVWIPIFKQNKIPYSPPGLVLFSNQTTSDCGTATSASGPFYCPADRKVYLDTAFFDQLARQLGAPGDFAQAYVIAHEFGHHVQNLLGKTGEMDKLRGRIPQAEYNEYSVRLELQADFYAGMMFNHLQKSQNVLEKGDIEEGLRAASAIGDDTLQKRSTGQANQETFTHGTSQQRVHWFMKGLQTGDPSQGDTFAAKEL